MKIQNIIRKVAAAATGSTLVGATLLGVAANLAEYPQQYMKDGEFNGHIVIGEFAATGDILGAVDIAASLQGSAVVDVPLPDTAGRVELTSEGYELQTASDRLELRENIGDTISTLSEQELPGLKSTTITTSEGMTHTYQYLRFKEGSQLQNMSVNYIENDDDEMDTYLVIETDQPFLEWELQLPEGLESSYDATTMLIDDFQGKTINLLGQDATIVQATLNPDGSNLEILLMAGAFQDTLREGEVRTYSIYGFDYEVAVVFISDPDSGGTKEVKLAVNGELTQPLEEGETDTLSNGFQIGIGDILVNDREGVVNFYLGAAKLQITDPSVIVGGFDASIEINNENINDATIASSGAFLGSGNVEITDIKYRLKMDAEGGSTVYIPPGHSVREFMDKPDGLLSNTFNIFFAGLEDVVVEPFEVKAQGEDEYDIIFTNIQGRTYRFPFLSNENGIFKFGDDDDELIFVEGDTGTDYVIGDDDYFIVSNDRGGFLGSDADKSVTNILRYEDYDDTDFTLELQDIASGSPINVPIQSNGQGSLVIGGHTYTVNVSNRSADQPTIAVDLNADGDWGNDVVSLTTWGGVIIDMAAAVMVHNTTNSSEILTATSSNGHLLSDFVRNGATLENGTDVYSTNDQQVNMSAIVLAKNFDTSDDGNEQLNWSLNEENANTQIDLALVSANYRGPLAGDLPGEAGEFQFDEPNDDLDDWKYGMTDWGIFVKLLSPDDSDEPDELLLEIPAQQRFAQVFVTLGQVQTSTGGSSTQVVNPIAVGLAVLDSEAPAVGSENLIVVGGPCANTVAAELLGNPANCAEGFEEGKGFIQFWDHGSAVSTLVAGYEQTETRGATSVLAAWQDYGLAGMHVDVAVTDLNDITVTPVFEEGFDPRGAGGPPPGY